MEVVENDPLVVPVAPLALGEPQGEVAKTVLLGDARHLSLMDSVVDLVVTSPPYWRKRDYGFEGQIGQEKSPAEYVSSILAALAEWRRVLRPTGSVFLNVGDTYLRKHLQGIPGLIEARAGAEGWIVRNRIIWVKKGGMPDPVQNRLAGRHEYILHLTGRRYYYDLFGYAEHYSRGRKGANPGDVWAITPRRDLGKHLAPFPAEIAERAITLACPLQVCTSCGSPRTRVVGRTADLDPSRPQARRALEIARDKNLTSEHIAAIQATGISDAGKARLVQTGTDRNAEAVRALAHEAKLVLGGYFREFTFAKRKTVRWTDCGCNTGFTRGVVLDPFMGTGTTLDVAERMGRSSVGVDLDRSLVEQGAE